MKQEHFVCLIKIQIASGLMCALLSRAGVQDWKIDLLRDLGKVAESAAVYVIPNRSNRSSSSLKPDEEKRT